MKFKKLCLTYDNHLLCDGSGAQIQRIAFIYGLAKKYKYHHSRIGIARIDSNPGDGMHSELEKSHLVSEINKLLVDPLENCSHSKHTEIKNRFTFLITKFNLYWLWLLLNNLTSLTKSNPQLKINHTLIARYPSSEIYLNYANKIKFDPNFIKWAKNNQKFEIQAHFLGAKNSLNKMSERFIESRKIIRILEVCKSHHPTWKILIHSDIDSSNQNWKIIGEQSIETIQYWKEGGILDEKGNFYLNPINLEKEFPANLVNEFATGISPLEVWKLMVNAKILLCGKSSLSFIGALLNNVPNALILAPRGFTKFPRNWIELDYEVAFEEFTLNKYVIDKLISAKKENCENS